MNLKFYLEKLHKNETYEEDDIDYVKQYIKEHIQYKSDFITLSFDRFLSFFTDKQLKTIFRLIELKQHHIICKWHVSRFKINEKETFTSDYGFHFRYIIGKFFLYKRRVFYPYFEIQKI